jgi:hypothetical protein
MFTCQRDWRFPGLCCKRLHVGQKQAWFVYSRILSIHGHILTLYSLLIQDTNDAIHDTLVRGVLLEAGMDLPANSTTSAVVNIGLDKASIDLSPCTIHSTSDFYL